MSIFEWDTESMSKGQYLIANYIEKNLQQVLFSTEKDIADALQISIATVSRFWRAAGYANMKEFKARVRSQMEVSPASKISHTLQRGSDSRHTRFLEECAARLEETAAHFSEEEMERAVDAVHRARHIHIYGSGPSAGLAEFMTYRLRRFGHKVHRLTKGGSELLEDLLHIEQGDLLFVFGFLRLLPETKVLLDHAKKAGCQTVLITDQLVSDFSSKADIVLFASRGEAWEYHSMVAPTFLVEHFILEVGKSGQEQGLHKLELLSELRKTYSSDLPR